MPEVLTRVDEGRIADRDAICGGCGYPYTFANAQTLNVKDWRRFCSRKCERNPDIEAEHERLRAAVVEAAKAEYLAGQDMSAAFDANNGERYNDAEHRRDISKTERIRAIKALLAFEAENKIGVDHETNT